jgi:photosystem II stability/assembly factor-like uncharacterized protein
MYILKHKFLLLFIFLFSVTAVSAQEGWNVNRAKGTGDLISVFFTSSDNGWVAGDDGYLAQTDDGGRSWKKRVLNTAANINEIYFRSDNDGYLVAGRKMFVTADGGKNWRETLIVDPNEFTDGIPEFLSIRFNNKKQGFIIGTIIDKNDDLNVIGSLVLRTTDGGQNWSRLVVPSEVELFHLDFDGRSRGWIVGDKGTILTTGDGGNSWQLQNSGTQETLYNVDFRDDREGYAVGVNGTILRTEDGGQNWLKVSSPVSHTLFRVDFSDDKNGWIVGSEGTILRSYDRGASWIRQESKTGNNLYGLFMQKKYGWSVGKDGVIIRYEK